MLSFFKVKGKSMSPFFNDGDYVLSFSKNKKNLNIGDIIIFEDPVHGRLIKKISSKEENGLKITGSHPESINSNSLGIIPYSNVIGKVVMKFSKKNKQKKQITENKKSS